MCDPSVLCCGVVPFIFEACFVCNSLKGKKMIVYKNSRLGGNFICCSYTDCETYRKFLSSLEVEVNTTKKCHRIKCTGFCHVYTWPCKE